MPGDDKSEPSPPPPTMEGLAALMTKLLSSMGCMEARITSMESRLQPSPTLTPAASMPYGMPGYGSTSSAPFSYGMSAPCQVPLQMCDSQRQERLLQRLFHQSPRICVPT